MQIEQAASKPRRRQGQAAAVAVAMLLAAAGTSVARAQTPTPCQDKSVQATPEVSNPPQCTAWYNTAGGSTTDGPFYPTPSEIRVSIQPSIWNTNCSAACNMIIAGGQPPDWATCCNDTPGFGGSHLSVAEAERYLRSFFSLFHSKTGSAISYRWVGRTATVTETFCSGADPAWPTLYIHNRPEAPADWSGMGIRYKSFQDDSMRCADLYYRLRDGAGGSALNWAYGDPYVFLPSPAANITRMTKHEVGHTLGLDHQACAPASHPAEDDHSATTGNCSFDNQPPPPGLMHEPVALADQRYFRLDYGVPGYTIREARTPGFAPLAWESPATRPHPFFMKVASPVSVTDSKDEQRGFAYNAWLDDGTSRLAVTLFDGGTWRVESTGAVRESWSRPDITKSFLSFSPIVPHYWMVAFLEGATPENAGSKYPSVVERPVGGNNSDWVYTNLQGLVPTTVSDPTGNRSGFDSIAVSYDPVSHRYVLLWLERETDAGTVETERIRVSTRAAWNVGGTWTAPQTLVTTRASDGADLACSSWPDGGAAGYNCLVVWSNPPYMGAVRFRKFNVNAATGAVSIAASDTTYGSFGSATGYHRPAVTVNPTGTHPQFLIAYTDWNAGGNIYTASLGPVGLSESVTFDQNAPTFVLPSASRYRWFGPPGLGTYVQNGTTYTNLSVAY